VAHGGPQAVEAPALLRRVGGEGVPEAVGVDTEADPLLEPVRYPPRAVGFELERTGKRRPGAAERI
jgi:hypothetical protein